MPSLQPLDKCQILCYVFLTDKVLAMNTTKTQILARIRHKGVGTVTTPKDFLDLAGRAAVDQALTRLVRDGKLQRIGRGLYHLPRLNKRLGISVPPDPDDVAQAIGRQTGSRVVPSPAAIANRLGLSTQVPAKPVYLTDGRSRLVRVGKQTYRLRHVAAKRLPDKDDPSSLALQAIVATGQSSLGDSVIATLRRQLNPAQRQGLLREARYADAWVADAARRIAAAEA
jgi:hypothetical protein